MRTQTAAPSAATAAAASPSARTPFRHRLSRRQRFTGMGATLSERVVSSIDLPRFLSQRGAGPPLPPSSSLLSPPRTRTRPPLPLSSLWARMGEGSKSIRRGRGLRPLAHTSPEGGEGEGGPRPRPRGGQQGGGGKDRGRGWPAPSPYLDPPMGAE